MYKSLQQNCYQIYTPINVSMNIHMFMCGFFKQFRQNNLEKCTLLSATKNINKINKINEQFYYFGIINKD